jgi:haloacetate dehalogenase
VATRFAKDYPDATDRLVVMDNIPTRVIFERMGAKVARGHWFFIFNNVHDLPEARIAGREEVWLRFIFSAWCYDPEPFTPEELAVYVRAYSQPGALRGAFRDYRAGEEGMARDEPPRPHLHRAVHIAAGQTATVGAEETRPVRGPALRRGSAGISRLHDKDGVPRQGAPLTAPAAPSGC